MSSIGQQQHKHYIQPVNSINSKYTVHHKYDRVFILFYFVIYTKEKKTERRGEKTNYKKMKLKSTRIFNLQKKIRKSQKKICETKC